ncbi:MAG: hypothetical protein ACYDBJ_21105 [Aggregatilineales bacterium]
MTDIRDQADRPVLSAPSAYRFSDGAIIGATLMVALLGVNYAAEAAWHIPFAPRTLGQWLHTTVPLGTGAWAVLYVLMGAGFGAVYERLRPVDSVHGMIGGALLGIVVFVVSLPPTFAAVQNTASGLPVVGIIGWFLLCVLWGLALDQTQRGAATRPVNPMDTDSPMTSRRIFLLQTVTGALLIALFSFPIARLLDGKQLLPNLPSLLAPSQATPIPPDQYF